MARTANNVAVFHGSRSVLRDGQRRFAGIRVRQRLTAKVKRDVLASSDGHIFGRIRQQRDGLAVLSGVDSSLQGIECLKTNLCDRTRNPMRAVRVLDRIAALSAQGLRD